MQPSYLTCHRGLFVLFFLAFYRYSAVFETDGHLVTDSFYFSVSDMDHNHLDNQMFTIMITPAENPPPVIAFADLITVNNSQINKQRVLWRAGICSHVNEGFLPKLAARYFPQNIQAAVSRYAWFSIMSVFLSMKINMQKIKSLYLHYLVNKYFCTSHHARCC